MKVYASRHQTVLRELTQVLEKSRKPTTKRPRWRHTARPQRDAPTALGPGMGMGGAGGQQPWVQWLSPTPSGEGRPPPNGTSAVANRLR